eukprot:CAMPEP_0167760512 /NCGR_PEP_ID=MMETSP0110_2-20121227/11630_1 /TAXON_ID=629695 /ORGANISM="Gymnochlora sp., Strain CCMP2014" /LENGTH=381 /DNA_ID=CAMNT_0007647037 /DNA_START=59 /DNA_END=1204 /DNA_ORIENTATION=-
MADFGLGLPPSSTRARGGESAGDTSAMTDEEYIEQKMRLMKFQSILKEMAKHVGNKRCADCREANPRYIDVNWGVYLCLLCSGAHEKVLASTIVTVDTTRVDKQWLETLQQRGNAKVNKDLEYKLEARDKRKMSWSITNRAKFATRKYVTGEWLAPNATIDLKNPTKVKVPEVEAKAKAAAEPKKVKKRGKGKRRLKKKKASAAPATAPTVTKEAPKMSFPEAEKTPQASAPPTKPEPTNDLFALFDGDAKEAKKETKAAPVAKTADKGAVNNILSIFDDTPAPQPQAQMIPPTMPPATQNPFQGGNPFATGYQQQQQPAYQPQYQQPQYGYPTQGFVQPMNQQDMWRMQQQQQAQQQMNHQQRQQQAQKQPNDILSSFFG